MKKFSIFLLLMAFFAPLAMNGQTTLLSEDFEGNSFNSFGETYDSNGWFAYNAGDGESIWVWEDDFDFGSHVMEYFADYDFDADCYLVSAPFTVSANMTKLTVSLSEATFDSEEIFEVFFVKATDINTAEAVASALHYPAINLNTYTNSVYEEIIPISGWNENSELAGQSVRVVVHCTSTLANGWLLYIDDITVTETVATTEPSITLSPNPATVAMGFTETLTATIDNVTGTPTISYSSSNTSVATVSGSGTTATVTGIAVGTATITATMSYEGTNYIATSEITVVEPSLCTPSFSGGTSYTSLGTYIASFSTTEGKTNINNSSSGLSTNGYGDYYDSYSLSAEAGQTIGFTVHPFSTSNAMKYAMWIDWNQDNVFNNEGENVAIQSNGIRTDWTGSFSIPAGTPVGNYRIRILGMHSSEGNLDPCKQGVNGEAEDYKLIVSDALVFATEGSWNDLANWTDAAGNAINVLPTLTDKVRIDKNVTIQNGTVGYAKEATLNGGTITIADGGQLKLDGTVEVTMEKTIAGYGSGNDNWYFIASPLTTTMLNYTEGLSYVNALTGNYDLYAFDPTEEQSLEWINYRSHSSHAAFTSGNNNPVLVSKMGYLYGNESTTNLEFNGTTAMKSFNNVDITEFTYDANSDDEFNGWALVGNPYTCNAYISYVDANNTVLTADFYTLNNDNTYSLMSSNTPLPPCTGAMINYSATGKVQFATEAPAKTRSMLNMTLSKDRSTVDQARVRFGQGYNLRKMSFRKGGSQLYIPQDNKSYAVAYTEEQGEMPINFKAENNGTYTLSFTTEEISFAYLHLIDNMTGNDVDLLKTPSYSFNAKSSDYESRFKLVFSTGNNTNDDTFAFYSNGSFIINNEGNATLQVIDVNGRILKSESINGCTSVNVNAAQGVYMLRLVNGDNVKVQKVVVR